MALRASAVSLALVTLFAVATPTQGYTGYSLTDVGNPGLTYFQHYGINDTGQVTGSFQGTRFFSWVAFIYSNGVMTALSPLDGSDSTGFDINSSGQVTGYAAPLHAFLYSDGVMTSLGTLGGTFSFGHGINDAGQVTGSAETSDGIQHAFLYSNGTMTDLGSLGGQRSAGYGINNTGQITGYSDTPDGVPHAFLYINGTMTDLGTLGGQGSVGYGINNAGQITGYSDTPDGIPHAFLYDNGVMGDLDTLGGLSSVGYDINDAGQVAGQFVTADGAYHAFVYSENSMHDLNDYIDPLSGWTLFSATGINNSGQIAGFGHLNGEPHIFLLTPTVPVPEPDILHLVAVGTGMVAWRSRRCGRRRPARHMGK